MSVPLYVKEYPLIRNAICITLFRPFGTNVLALLWLLVAFQNAERWEMGTRDDVHPARLRWSIAKIQVWTRGLRRSVPVAATRLYENLRDTRWRWQLISSGGRNMEYLLGHVRGDRMSI